MFVNHVGFCSLNQKKPDHIELTRRACHVQCGTAVVPLAVNHTFICFNQHLYLGVSIQLAVAGVVNWKVASLVGTVDARAVRDQYSDDIDGRLVTGDVRHCCPVNEIVVNPHRQHLLVDAFVQVRAHVVTLYQLVDVI